MDRRTFLLGTAATAAVTSPFIRTAFAQEVSAAGPTQPTAGAIRASERITGYTVDSVRNHSINTYFLRGAREVGIIDTLWRTPEAEEALAALPRISGEDPSAISSIAITHPHSDHYGGLSAFRAASGGAPAFTTRNVSRVIANDEHGFYANRREDFGDDIPATIAVPQPALIGGENFKVGGLQLVPRVLRGNEAIETALIYAPDERVLFTGDVVNNKTTPVFYQGGIDAWAAQLSDLRRQFPDAATIAPGHGEPGDFDTLVADELAYLTLFRDSVQSELERGGGVIGAAGIARIKTAMVEAFPDWRTSAGVPSRDRLIELNIVWTLRGWRIADTSEGSPAEFRE